MKTGKHFTSINNYISNLVIRTCNPYNQVDGSRLDFDS